MEGEEGEEKEMCSVCYCEYEPDEEVLVLPCKHFYHADCVSQWLRINKTCPVCRQPIAS